MPNIKILSRSALFSFFLGLFCLPSAHAILNIEAIRLKQHDPGFGGALGLSYERREGNTDRFQLKANSQIIYRGPDSEILGFIENETGQSHNKSDINRSIAHLRYARAVEMPVSLEIYGQYERNQFTRLSFRGLAGAGMRWRWYRKDDYALYSGIGGYWSRERLEKTENATDDGLANYTRANLYLSAQLPLQENIRFRAIAYYQPKVDALVDYQILLESEIEFKVTENLSFTSFYNLSYDNKPPQLVGRDDHRYGTEIKFNF